MDEIKLKKRNTCMMDEGKDIYKQWVIRNKMYCSDEQDMFIGYSKSKKLTVFDHYKRKYIVFDFLKAYWKMSDNTPKTYQCFEEVVFNNVSQSPVIEIGLTSSVKYLSTKIVEIVRTVLNTMIEIFHTHYTNYINIAPVPSTLDDFVVIDKILQRDGEWYYFFHIQATSFYFPCYLYCSAFRKKLCASLPLPISFLIYCPEDYIFQLVGISGSYLLSLEDKKRISPTVSFLGLVLLSTGMIYSLHAFLPCMTLSHMHHCISLIQTIIHLFGGSHPEISVNDFTKCLSVNPCTAQYETVNTVDEKTKLSLMSVTIEKNETKKISENKNSVVCEEQIGMNEQLLHEYSSIRDCPKADEVPAEPVERNITGIGQPLVNPFPYSKAISCSMIFISELSAEKIWPHDIDPNTLSIYAVINCMAILFGICKKLERHSSGRAQCLLKDMNRNIGTVVNFVWPDRGKHLPQNGLDSQKGTTMNNIKRCKKTILSETDWCNGAIQNILPRNLCNCTMQNLIWKVSGH
ncbi:hypothetical protein C1646_673695 [Rhizophagus diaphanus]|nr:hypothetical protein C1646_673695 [Rhizophagus diaphanus] [Rhizophagus sp. MUCL 43196]